MTLEKWSLVNPVIEFKNDWVFNPVFPLDTHTPLWNQGQQRGCGMLNLEW